MISSHVDVRDQLEVSGFRLLGLTSPPKKCRILVVWTVLRGFGPLFYLLRVNKCLLDLFGGVLGHYFAYVLGVGPRSRYKIPTADLGCAKGPLGVL